MQLKSESMRVVKYRAMVLVLIILLPAVAIGQTRAFYEHGHHIEHFNDTRIIDHDVGDIWKDPQGLLWIVNVGNVLSYDGYAFELYQPDASNRLNDARDQFERVMVDSKKNIWLSSIQGGIVKYDANKRQYHRIAISENQFTDYGSDHIAEDNEGNIWVGHTKGLMFFPKGQAGKASNIEITSVAPRLKALIDSTGMSKIAVITEAKSQAELVQTFQIDRDQEVLVVGQGHLQRTNRYGLPTNVFGDYGWIQDQKGHVVWEMDASTSLDAGPLVENRLCVQVIDLPEGSYTLHFQSDDSYAFEDWLLRLGSSSRFTPPSVPEWWGIQVYALDVDQKKAFVETLEKHQEERGLSSSHTDIFKDQEGSLWVFGHALEKLIKNNSGSWVFESFGNWDSRDGVNNWSRILTLTDHDKDHLWVSYATVDPIQGEVIKIGLFNKQNHHFQEVNTGLPKHRRYDALQQDNDGNLWVASSNNYGLFRISPPFIKAESPGEATVTSFHLREDDDPIQRIKCLAIDDFNHLWIGTHYDGLFSINLDPLPFDYVRLTTKPELKLLQMTTIQEDKGGTMWLTSSPFSLIEYHPSTDEIKVYNDNFKGIDFEIILYIDELPNGHLIFQTERGLIVWDRASDKAILHEVTGLEITSIAYRRPAQGKGFILDEPLLYVPGYLVNTDSWTVFKDLDKYIDGGRMLAEKSQDGGIWLSNSWGELGKFALRGEHLDTIQLQKSFIYHLDLLEDRDRSLWIATNFNLKMIDTTGHERFFSAKDGLNKPNLLANLFQDENKIWLFSSLGTSVVDLVSFEVSKPGQIADLAILDAFEDDAGRYILLDENGYYHFDPSDLKTDPLPPMVHIKSLSYGKDDERQVITQFGAHGLLELAYRFNDLTFEYVGVHFKNSEKTTYAYRLQGIPGEWQYVDKERTARFLNLPPGEYTFIVKAANEDDVWSEETQFSFKVLPPWWRTWWAKTIYALAILGSLYGYIQNLRAKVRQKQEQLEKEQAFSHKLEVLNKANERFVPKDFLHILGKYSIEDLHLGDQTQIKMTVLFADIRSYTSLSETMSPEDNFKFINGYLGRVGPIIRKHGGFIDKYMGDGLMALFLENDQSPVKAAIEMQEAINAYNEERKKKGRKPIKTGIGLNTGELMLGVIGDRHRYDSTVISDAVNTASRMEGLTKVFGASVIISERVRRELSTDALSMRYLGQVKVKGRDKALKIFDLYQADTDDILHLKEKTLKQFEKGIRLYFKEDFGKAADCLKEVIKVNEHDLAAQYYLDRSIQYIMDGVPDDWTGVEEMVLK